MRTRILLLGLLAAGAASFLLWLGLRAGARDTAGASPGEGPGPDALAEAAFELIPAEAPAAEGAPSRSPQLPAVQPASRAPRPGDGARRTEAEDAPARRWLTATFLRADLAPASGAKVECKASQPRSGRVEQALALDDEGRLRLDLADAWSGVHLCLALAEHARFERFVELPSTPGVLDLGVLVLSAGGALEGVVRGPVGFHSWSLSILPRPAGVPSFVPRGTTGFSGLDVGGGFRFEHVPAGKVELTLFHPLLGSVLEEEFEVREGATTPVELVYSGTDPARALFVQVGIGREPLASELWLTDAEEHSLAPSSIRGGKAWFEELDEGAFTLTLAVAGHEPVLKRDVRRGMRVEIGFPPVPPPASALHASRQKWNGQELQVMEVLAPGAGSGEALRLHLGDGESVRLELEKQREE